MNVTDSIAVNRDAERNGTERSFYGLSAEDPAKKSHL
jgi:hypothetical protein